MRVPRCRRSTWRACSPTVSLGEDAIGLRVDASNGPALNLYRSLGFQEI
jgi:ribosomal protein S18 acetylase RimI-like enzyme